MAESDWADLGWVDAGQGALPRRASFRVHSADGKKKARTTLSRVMPVADRRHNSLS